MKFFSWHEYFVQRIFGAIFFAKSAKKGKNTWFFECHVFSVGVIIFLW